MSNQVEFFGAGATSPPDDPLFVTRSADRKHTFMERRLVIRVFVLILTAISGLSSNIAASALQLVLPNGLWLTLGLFALLTLVLVGSEVLAHVEAERFSKQREPLEKPYAIPPTRIVVSHEPAAETDANLAAQLATELTKEHESQVSFAESNGMPGTDRSKVREQQIGDSDFVIALISHQSVRSPELVETIKVAYDHYTRSGRLHPRIIPVRVQYTASFPDTIAPFLKTFISAEWNDIGDSPMLVRTVQKAISQRDRSVIPPSPHVDPGFIQSLDDPRGVVRPNSRFYIERESDTILQNELQKDHGATVTIRGIRQTGKTSLLFRGIKQAREQGNTIIYIDMTTFGQHQLRGLDTFLKHFATTLITALKLDESVVEQLWRSQLSAPQRLTNLVEGYIFSQIQSRITLAIDEVDLLLRTSFYNDFFSLLRSWHNNRAMNQVWERFDILLVISTDPHLLISDLNQSPFNVGTRMLLEDFNTDQIAQLNWLYRSPLRESSIPQLIEFLDGHPYLTSQALYTMRKRGINWNDLERIAATEQSPFFDHLQHYQRILGTQPRLRQALKQVIRLKQCPDEEAYYRLVKAGLIKGMHSKACTCRCKLYEIYFKDKP